MEKPKENKRVIGFYGETKKLVYVNGDGTWTDALFNSPTLRPDRWEDFDPFSALISEQEAVNKQNEFILLQGPLDGFQYRRILDLKILFVLSELVRLSNRVRELEALLISGGCSIQ